MQESDPDRTAIEQAIGSFIAGARVRVAGMGEHRFDVLVEAPEFAEKPRVECHRVVYDALASVIDRGVCALVVHTRGR